MTGKINTKTVQKYMWMLMSKTCIRHWQ